MEDLLTTQQVLDLLQINRITVYRMLQDGRIKGVKIGQQWRFPRREVERLLRTEQIQAEAAQPGAPASFPTHCIQTLQELFSGVSEIGARVVDGEGKPLTQVSHACRFCELLGSSPSGQRACQASWQELAGQPDLPGRIFTCHAGLNYTCARLHSGGQVLGWFLVGQFTLQEPDPAEQLPRLKKLAAQHGLDLAEL